MPDKFDVYEACYAYAAENHSGQWSRAYALFGKLDAKGFRPGLRVTEHGYAGLTEEGKLLYNRMLALHY